MYEVRSSLFKLIAAKLLNTQLLAPLKLFAMLLLVAPEPVKEFLDAVRRWRRGLAARAPSAGP